MSQFSNCLKVKLKAGIADKQRAKAALEQFDIIEAAALQRMSPEEAARFAADEVVKQVKRANFEKRRYVALTAQVQDRIKFDLNNYRDGRGEKNLAKAAEALFSRDSYATYSALEIRQDTIRGQAHAGMSEILANFRRTLTGGVRDKAGLENIVREIFGQNSGDKAAKELADSWGQVAETLRQRFNRAGGRIPKRSDWGMPQTHDTLKVRKVSYEQWRTFVAPKLNTAKMIDELTGAPITPERLEISLRNVYEAISTDGGNRLTPSGRSSGTSTAARHLDHRWLVFRDAENWLDYNAEFGQTDPFSAMMGHIDIMSRDISMMEILGPNPNATKNWLEDVIIKSAKLKDAKSGGGKALNQASKSIHKINAMYRLVTGETTMPVDGVVANIMAGARQFLISMQLGGAFLSALSDIGFGMITSRYNGLKTFGALKRTLKLFNPKNIEDQKLAVRLGLIAENWSGRALAQARYTGDVAFGQIGSRISDGVLRASLLSSWTQAGRHAFGMEFLGTLADLSGKKFGQLPEAISDSLKRHAINSGDWDAIRSAKLLDEQGVKFLDPAMIRKLDGLVPGRAENLSTKVMEMIRTETEAAVPSTNLRGRVALFGDSRPGTIGGEILRSFAMYKSFSATLYYTHIRRLLDEKTLARKGSYAAQLLIATTAFGALAMQAKQIAAGKDPRPMNNKEFIGAALLQGGGLGIFGDFLSASENRFGGGISSTIAGPVSGLGQDILSLTAGNALEAARGEDLNFGRDSVNFLKRYTPGGSMWYLSLGFQRLIESQIQTNVDPKARRAFRAKEKKLKKDFDQRYWWRPGKGLPDRGPDLSNIAEN